MKQLALIPIAFICIVITPFILWSAESQNREKDFSSAKEVSIDSSEDGYILVEGEADLINPIDCPESSTENKCIYVKETKQKFVLSEEKVCSSSKPEEKITKTLPSSCDENGNNCTPCYMVEKQEWEDIDSSESFSKFKIGNYEVNSISGVKFYGLEEYIKYLESTSSSLDDSDYYVEYDEYYDYYDETAQNTQQEDTYEAGDERIVYSFLENDSQLVVSGNARKLEISKEDKPFVISSLSYSETKSQLKSEDSSTTWMLRIVSFITLVGGITTIAAALASLPLAVTKLIPFIGGKLSKGISSFVTMVAFAISVVMWFVLFAIVIILKNILLIAVSFTVILTIFTFVLLAATQLGKKEVTEKQ